MSCIRALQTKSSLEGGRPRGRAASDVMVATGRLHSHLALAVQRGCTAPQIQTCVNDTAYREQRKHGWQRCRFITGKTACPTLVDPRLHRLQRLGRASRTCLQAVNLSGPGRSGDPAFDRLPVVDITAESVSTSGRGVENNRDQQPRPNIVWRAAAAAVGLIQAMVQWLQAHVKPWRLFDR